MAKIPAVIYLTDESGLYPKRRRLSPAQKATLYAGAAAGVMASASASAQTVKPAGQAGVYKTYRGTDGEDGFIDLDVTDGNDTHHEGYDGKEPTTAPLTDSTPYVITGAPVYHLTGIGGDGGDGIDFFGDHGGQGGRGGNAQVTIGGTQSLTASLVAPLTNNAIAAVSRGGRGGDGGEAFNVGDAQGGSGGDGGTGGTARAEFSGALTLKGSGAAVGVLAQSLGGGGGTGGPGHGAFANQSGAGGKGGAGGSATARLTGTVATSGAQQYGVAAQSIGASGGGSSAPGGLFGNSGGDGGSGGSGGAARVETTANSLITTGAIDAVGVLIQSVGGGGGAGSTAEDFGGAVGGDGGAGTRGGAVTSDLAGSIVTQGTRAHGVLAQSIGGGGGVAGSGSGFGNSAATIGSVGGTGGGGSRGGEVTLLTQVTSRILTAGNDAHGIFAQSIGGGGGAGGSSQGLISIGGSGSAGGDGRAVLVTNNGSIGTGGERAFGVLAQSIGGGGGSAPDIAGVVAIGGSGSGGGTASTVDVVNNGLIETAKAGAHGIVAQSIGGGGGNGATSYGALFALGGSASAGGSSDKVTVGGTGTVRTGGAGAIGIVAQSIGGGGGNAGGAFTAGAINVSIGGTGGAGGVGGKADVTIAGQLSTAGDNALGVLAQSIGGGGGNGGFAAAFGGAPFVSLNAAVGGKGATGGSANEAKITVTGAATVQTGGNDATALTAQSVGGGGGNGGFATSGAFAAGGVGVAATVAVGGAGAKGGDGGAAKIDAAGTIATGGDRSHAVLAQSVGGGGGNGGWTANLAASAGIFAGSVAVGVGGKGGAGGVGGEVTVTGENSALATRGDDAGGIVAQSIGGGGGNGGFSMAGALAGGIKAAGAAAVAVGGSGDTGGKGGTVTIDRSGSIATLGSRASGIAAQSLGGGGGNGGWSGTLSGAAAGVAGFGVGVTLGGGGAGGGIGDLVKVTNGKAGVTSVIQTAGNDAAGILAQSVGGGGGLGGASVGAAAGGAGTASFNAVVGLGGAGGTGSAGGVVDVTSLTAITTAGDRSNAIIAQSIGGGGGAGGGSVAVTAGGGGTFGGNISVGLGGEGAGGGSGQSVTVTSTGALSTGTLAADGRRGGHDSSGIAAQSIGGGGGAGGFAVAVAAGGGGTAGVSGGAAVGGTGAVGGNGGVVTVTGTGDIVTRGDRSRAVMAQSIGGGGGSGGFSATGVGAVGGTGVALGASLGGNGAGGGFAQKVTLTQTGASTTLGDDAQGLLAQSIGGGGGAGGMSVSLAVAGGRMSGAAAVALGGGGGAGGAGGEVVLTNRGAIGTSGDRAQGILAQSIGGGGGAGGFSIAAAGALGQKSAAGGVSLGGSGAVGGIGQAVGIDSRGDIATRGDDAAGALAQSIGGGGGAGGASLAAGVALALQQGVSAGVSLGGSGGGGNHGGTATLTSIGTINTVGDRAVGAGVQSIGGGGGSGGFSGALALTAAGQSGGGAAVALGGSGKGGGNGADAKLTVDGAVFTQGDDSHGLLAQSIGGGGGSGGLSVAVDVTVAQQKAAGVGVSLGGAGGAGGNGLGVTVKQNGVIGTGGDRANAILAQSIGGGGGAGGFSGALAIEAAKADAKAVAVSLGGSGGSGGSAGVVDVTASGDLRTGGDDAKGVLAQSIGGGGGTGGGSIAVAAGAVASGGATSIGVSLGGGGGTGNNAEQVTVTTDGTIGTTGARSAGVLAQSIGGGGGAGGFSGALGGAGGAGSGSQGSGRTAALSFGGSGAGAGDGRTVTVNSTSAVDTTGQDSHGIAAQSIGGGGGQGGMTLAGDLSNAKGAKQVALALGGAGGAAGRGGDVGVDSKGAVATHGDHSYGVLGQSVGGGGGDAGAAAALTIAAGNAAGAGGSAPIGISLALGGQGGGGGRGGDVTVKIATSVFTEGEASHAVFAQSVGGSGGSGAMAVAGAFSNGAGKNIAAGVGGAGGTGDVGGTVKVEAGGTIATTGASAAGIYAQSIGGGGGSGGMGGAMSASRGTPGASGGKSTAVSLQVGGAGGTGNIGGAVTVTSGAVIDTAGEMGHGIVAQSIGGGGGAGGVGGIDSDLVGDYFQGGSVSTGNNALNVAVALGGNGGSGNNGGRVDVTNSGRIVTRAGQSNAIYAQSVGGGGGDAGMATAVAGSFAITGGRASANSKTQNFGVAIGGTGAGGGDGGAVGVRNQGGVLTLGDAGHGIVAQSIGGGGGAGGDASAYAKVFATGIKQAQADKMEKKNTAVAVSIGGAGGAAGRGGAVDVANAGTVETQGAGAYGIFAQSVGGGGGLGGSMAGQLDTVIDKADMLNKASAREVTVNVGGTGAGGGDGGRVTLANTASVRSFGDQSHAVFAQSIGGGGGVGGSGADGNINLGGNGGVSGNGGAVAFDNKGAISTAGQGSYGVFLQSVGGGGGAGGANAAPEAYDDVPTISAPEEGIAKTMSLGGQGGAAGNGGDVTFTNSGQVVTRGAGANAVFLQSIGGGGGNGGNAGGGTINIGGQGGSTGDGGTVRATNAGGIYTEGKQAAGIFAQSIGGGGGAGGSVGIEDTAASVSGTDGVRQRTFAALSLGAATIELAQQVRAQAQAGGFAPKSVSVGGFGSSGGNGGAVVVENTGVIATQGTLSYGIFAQSVGGGGGVGGAGTLGPANFDVAGGGGMGGNGGTVTVRHTGDIVTTGYGAYGIFAQSVGGGGGVMGDVSFGMGKLGTPGLTVPLKSAGGDGGDVTVISTGNISVGGGGATAIFAQSVGGGGGLWNGDGLLGQIGSLGLNGKAGKVTVVHTGDAFATDVNGIAALFESHAKDGVADIDATLNGNFRGGSVFGKGVLLDGGLNNILTVNGSASAVSGNAIVGNTGNDTVRNNGLVVGNVDLDGRTSDRAAEARAGEVNRFDNAAKASFLSGDRVSLGVGGTLSNAGVLAPGGDAKLQVTTLTGSLVQGANGNYLTDLDFGRGVFNAGGQFTDRVNATGSAQVGGFVTLAPQNVGEVRSGSRRSVLIQANGGLTSALVAAAPGDGPIAAGIAGGVPTLVAPTSAIASFGLVNTGTQLVLATSVDFAGVGRSFNRNRTAVGDYFNRVQDAGSSAALSPVVNQLFFTPTAAGLARQYDSFGAELHADQLAGAVYSSGRFADAAASCAREGIVTADGCTWLQAGGNRLRLDGTAQNFAAREKGGFVRFGAEHRLGDSDFHVGLALAADDVNTRVNGDQAEGQRYQGALGFHYRALGADASLVGTFGGGRVNSKRAVLTPGGASTARGEQTYTFGTVAIDAGYRLALGDAWLRPGIAASWTWYDQQRFIENGAGALSLSVDGRGGNVYRVSPNLELGGTALLGGGVTLTGSVKAAYTRMANPDVAVAARFVGAPIGPASFATRAFLDRDYADVAAGVTLKTAGGTSFRIGYDGTYGDRTRNHTASAKLTVPF